MKGRQMAKLETLRNLGGLPGPEETPQSLIRAVGRPPSARQPARLPHLRMSLGWETEEDCATTRSLTAFEIQRRRRYLAGFGDPETDRIRAAVRASALRPAR